MADKKISDLTAATTPLAGTEVLPIVQSTTTKKVSVANLTAGRDIATKQITSTVSGATTAVEGWNITNGVASAIFMTTGATYAYRGVGANNIWLGTNGGNDMYIGASTANVLRLGSNAFSYLEVGTTGNISIISGNLVFSAANKTIEFAGNGSVIWRTGAGTPEGAVTAPVGSLFTRTDGGANTTLYVKESGTGNTGWVAK